MEIAAIRWQHRIEFDGQLLKDQHVVLGIVDKVVALFPM
jgi:hypothetical protein